MLNALPRKKGVLTLAFKVLICDACGRAHRASCCHDIPDQVSRYECGSNTRMVINRIEPASNLSYLDFNVDLTAPESRVTTRANIVSI